MQNLSELFNVNCFMVSQTNPWVIPFMNHSEQYRYSKKYMFIRAYEVFKNMVASELVHRVNQLASIGIFPQAVTRYFNLITQVYSGTVTIWPVPTLKDFLNILNNPTPQTLQRGLILGQQRTYAKISHIQATLCIEKAIDLNYRAIKLSKETLMVEDDEDDYDKKSILGSASHVDIESLILEDTKRRCGRLSSFIIPRTQSISEIKKFIRTHSGKKLPRLPKT